jgi:hypothetical protein
MSVQVGVLPMARLFDANSLNRFRSQLGVGIQFAGDIHPNDFKSSGPNVGRNISARFAARCW